MQRSSRLAYLVPAFGLTLFCLLLLIAPLIERII